MNDIKNLCAKIQKCYSEKYELMQSIIKNRFYLQSDLEVDTLRILLLDLDKIFNKAERYDDDMNPLEINTDDYIDRWNKFKNVDLSKTNYSKLDNATILSVKYVLQRHSYIYDGSFIKNTVYNPKSLVSIKTQFISKKDIDKLIKLSKEFKILLKENEKLLKKHELS